jgi:hypothetical protein
VHDAGAGGTTRKLRERLLAPLEELVALAVALELELRRCGSSASALANASTCTEWSMTRSHGTSGLIFFGSPPRRCIGARIAARSTTHGTPVKSCSTTRPGRNGISMFCTSFEALAHQ